MLDAVRPWYAQVTCIDCAPPHPHCAPGIWRVAPATPFAVPRFRVPCVRGHVRVRVRMFFVVFACVCV
jgi:hypothetical protein